MLSQLPELIVEGCRLRLLHGYGFPRVHRGARLAFNSLDHLPVNLGQIFILTSLGVVVDGSFLLPLTTITANFTFNPFLLFNRKHRDGRSDGRARLQEVRGLSSLGFGLLLENALEKFARCGVTDTFALNAVLPSDERIVFRSKVRHLRHLRQHGARLENGFTEFLQAIFLLSLANVHDVLASSKRSSRFVIQFEVRHALQKCFFCGRRVAEDGSETGVAVTLRRASLLLLRLHVHGLQVVIELKVDSTLSWSKLNITHIFFELDLIDFSNVLSHVTVQKALRHLPSSLVPLLCRLLLKELERLHLRDFRLVIARNFVAAEVDTE
mmetsp:Transcript_1963/g.7639  ORF Transcript_1963/g.7639 Transcript_1963/m.7639 type:complete len:325 (+) Transcript_1963:969-1943(+)